MGKIKASIRAKVGYVLKVVKQQFGYTKARYWRMKNTLQLKTVFAPSNLWIGVPSIAGRAGVSAPEGKQNGRESGEERLGAT